MMKNGAPSGPSKLLGSARRCPSCEERPCVVGQRLCQQCRTAYQRLTRAKYQRRRLELAARRLLGLLTRGEQEKVREMAEEREQSLSSVLAGLVSDGLEGKLR